MDFASDLLGGDGRVSCSDLDREGRRGRETAVMSYEHTGAKAIE